MCNMLIPSLSHFLSILPSHLTFLVFLCQVQKKSCEVYNPGLLIIPDISPKSIEHIIRLYSVMNSVGRTRKENKYS